MKPLLQIDRSVYAPYQETLLRKAEAFFGRKGPHPAIRDAFLQTPRHWFASRYYSPRNGRWIDLTQQPELGEKCLGEIYQDNPLAIYRENDGRIVSTISQPSLVLYMLELLDLQPGHKVIELGGGSGWHAAMMGRLVGPTGKVISIEIVPQLEKIASLALDRCDLPQVEWICGDGSKGAPDAAPFQRGVFTASAWDLPTCFFDQIELEGLLLLVLRLRPGSDLLAMLRKQEPRRFASELQFNCSFVPVTGEHRQSVADPVRLEAMQRSGEAPPGAPQARRWEETKVPHEEIPLFIDFATTIWDCQQPYLIDRGRQDFYDEFLGYKRPSGKGFVFFNDDTILSLGDDEALIELRRAAKRWLKAGKPNVEELRLSIYASDTRPPPAQDQWLVERGDCILAWSLP